MAIYLTGVPSKGRQHLLLDLFMLEGHRDFIPHHSARELAIAFVPGWSLGILLFIPARHAGRLPPHLFSWQSLSPHFILRIATNISSRHFASPHLTDRIDAVFRETQIDPAALQLEIPASSDPETTSVVLSQLMQLRLATALDDYGTGALSLSQLRRAALDLVKIDRSLVRNMLSDSTTRDVVELWLALGRQWKVNVLAQGIEKASQ